MATLKNERYKIWNCITCFWSLCSTSITAKFQFTILQCVNKKKKKALSWVDMSRGITVYLYIKQAQQFLIQSHILFLFLTVFLFKVEKIITQGTDKYNM